MDRVNSNDPTSESVTHHQPATCSSDDDHLETLGRKVNELLTEKCLYRGNNGNDHGADSWSDEGETLKGRDFPLRRRRLIIFTNTLCNKIKLIKSNITKLFVFYSIARRPIGPGVRSRRHKQNSAMPHCSPQQHRQRKQSDEEEEETSEIPSSQHSTLEGHSKVNKISREVSLSDGESASSYSGRDDLPNEIQTN